ncbi:helix-turn-helix domain-containing protein [Nocardia albiluteola]|uniref:helix-turn-helix domain-containing protein n=1 Tax=Nocardia albiluteola TaxID=2842303 RepID=UPI0027E08A1F|nr:helix-turn-helix domain-containing protein [Nocardia albiluteola]
MRGADRGPPDDLPRRAAHLGQGRGGAGAAPRGRTVRNTVTYRLARVHELTGLDPPRPTDAMTLSATRIARRLETSGFAPRSRLFAYWANFLARNSCPMGTFRRTIETWPTTSPSDCGSAKSSIPARR